MLTSTLLQDSSELVSCMSLKPDLRACGPENGGAMERKRIEGLGKATTIFAVLMLLSFGLCGLEQAFPSKTEVFGAISFFGFLGAVLSALGLVGVGTAALMNLITGPNSQDDKPKDSQ